MTDTPSSSGPSPEQSNVEPAQTPPPAPDAPVVDRAPGERRGARPFRRDRGPRESGRPPEIKPLDDLTQRGPNLRELDAVLEDELNAAMAGFDQHDLVKPSTPTNRGEAGPKKGRVVAVHGEDVFVDVPGGRSQGLLSLDQFDEGAPAVGTEVDIEIDGYDRANGLLILKRRGAVQHVDWSSVEQGMVVEARVLETNKGGLSVDVNGIRGFMPISQIDMYRVEQPEQFVNQRLRCVVTEVQPTERNLVVSRRALLERDRDEQREKFWAGLETGQTRSGLVRSIQPFGAFVDLGGADGLIPIGELAWTRVSNVEEVVKVGQRVEVKVVKVDRDAKRIGLSLRQLTDSPWDSLDQRIIPGQVLSRTITRLQDFGAFVELEPGIEGLIHISELAPQRISQPSAVVQVGQVVNVKVLGIDKENRRVSLSIKQAMAAPEPEPEPVDAEEEAVAPPKPRPRNPNLRGGVGSRLFIPPLESAGGSNE